MSATDDHPAPTPSATEVISAVLALGKKNRDHILAEFAFDRTDFEYRLMMDVLRRFLYDGRYSHELACVTAACSIRCHPSSKHKFSTEVRTLSACIVSYVYVYSVMPPPPVTLVAYNAMLFDDELATKRLGNRFLSRHVQELAGPPTNRRYRHEADGYILDLVLDGPDRDDTCSSDWLAQLALAANQELADAPNPVKNWARELGSQDLAEDFKARLGAILLPRCTCGGGQCSAWRLIQTLVARA